MAGSKNKKKDPLPQQFDSMQEAGKFWDTHSSADYEEFMEPAHFDVDLRGSSTEVRVSDKIMRDVRKIARREGVKSETLVNLWLQEKAVVSGVK